MKLAHLIGYVYDNESNNINHKEDNKSHANSTIVESYVQKPTKKIVNYLNILPLLSFKQTKKNSRAKI